MNCSFLSRLILKIYLYVLLFVSLLKHFSHTIDFTRELVLLHFRDMISFVKRAEVHFERNLTTLIWKLKEILEVIFLVNMGG